MADEARKRFREAESRLVQLACRKPIEQPQKPIPAVMPADLRPVAPIPPTPPVVTPTTAPPRVVATGETIATIEDGKITPVPRREGRRVHTS